MKLLVRLLSLYTNTNLYILLLGSDVVQRWALIGWLHSLCATNASMAEARLALFYDYLAYDPEQHKIMNIEPAILLMHHSVRTYTSIAATLMEFICKLIDEYFPQIEGKILQGQCILNILYTQ